MTPWGHSQGMGERVGCLGNDNDNDSDNGYHGKSEDDEQEQGERKRAPEIGTSQ